MYKQTIPKNKEHEIEFDNLFYQFNNSKTPMYIYRKIEVNFQSINFHDII